MSLKIPIEELQIHAKLRGGKLKSIIYINCKLPLLWECRNRHCWSATWASIKHNNGWCPYCSKKAKPDLKILQNRAKTLGGRLISTFYINAQQKLRWECKNKHIWQTTWTAINNQKQWCPECATFKTETLVKKTLENKLNLLFKKQRIYYDSTNKHKYYEFDGYNKEHKIAFEYHGYQHYIYPNYWHKTKEIFIKAQQRDKEKEQYCKDKGIKLIIIPYTEEKQIEQYINTL